MEFDIDRITQDMATLTEEEFVMKYIIKSPNWYFSTYLKNETIDAMDRIDTLNEIVSKGFGVSFHCATMVGSAKVGFSLSPKKGFKPFTAEEGPDNHVSDIDIAIVSEKLFLWAWDSIRDAKKKEVLSTTSNTKIAREIFRGYINEKTMTLLSSTRKAWNQKAGPVTRDIQSKLRIIHPISYRIYRSWEDLEEYQIDCIRQLKLK